MLPSKCLHAACLFIGDTRQFPPLTLTTGQDNFKSIFGPQRGMSLFKRIETTSRITFELARNHRARVNAAELEQSTESKIGHSYASTVNSNFVCQFIVQMYRQASILNAEDVQAALENVQVQIRRGSVLILTGYAVQKNAHELLIWQLTPVEIPKELVEVRTIDESPSHEADIVIVDCVRSEQLGFINNRHCLSVMTTRARVATLLVGTDRKMLFPEPFADLIDYLTHRKAIVDLLHYGSRLQVLQWCRSLNACLSQGQENAISIYTKDPSRPDDGVERNALRHPNTVIAVSSSSSLCSVPWNEKFKVQDNISSAARIGTLVRSIPSNSPIVNPQRRVTIQSGDAMTIGPVFRNIQGIDNAPLVDSLRARIGHPWLELVQAMPLSEMIPGPALILLNERNTQIIRLARALGRRDFDDIVWDKTDLTYRWQTMNSDVIKALQEQKLPSFDPSAVISENNPSIRQPSLPNVHLTHSGELISLANIPQPDREPETLSIDTAHQIQDRILALLPELWTRASSLTKCNWI
ncbi:hypothetical protein NM208_g11782 [Fusarium decemcellulare]|uniref:Uncharacterized protein n=1 Tax=Fusarium decemcellulare TaxID=57161 RepID=A0ACC1RUK4_9HYPO|nr:hypothetical protein NM208_g11782 [Fusarium decemcellulare]